MLTIESQSLTSDSHKRPLQRCLPSSVAPNCWGEHWDSPPPNKSTPPLVRSATRQISTPSAGWSIGFCSADRPMQAKVSTISLPKRSHITIHSKRPSAPSPCFSRHPCRHASQVTCQSINGPYRDHPHVVSIAVAVANRIPIVAEVVKTFDCCKSRRNSWALPLRKEPIMQAIISDIHGNLEALTAVLGQIESLGIEHIVCLVHPGLSWVTSASHGVW